QRDLLDIHHLHCVWVRPSRDGSLYGHRLGLGEGLIAGARPEGDRVVHLTTNLRDGCSHRIRHWIVWRPYHLQYPWQYVRHQEAATAHSNQWHGCRTDFHTIHTVGNHLPHGIHTTLDKGRLEAL